MSQPCCALSRSWAARMASLHEGLSMSQMWWICTWMGRMEGDDERRRGRDEEESREGMKGTHEDGHTANIEGDVGDELHVGLARGFAWEGRYKSQIC